VQVTTSQIFLRDYRVSMLHPSLCLPLSERISCIRVHNNLLGRPAIGEVHKLLQISLFGGLSSLIANLHVVCSSKGSHIIPKIMHQRNE
jgi:hypothetical protein